MLWCFPDSCFKIKVLVPSAAGGPGAQGVLAEFSSNSKQLKKASLPKVLPHPWKNLLSMTCGYGLATLLQGRTTVKSYSSPRAPRRIGQDLCCKCIAVQFLPWPRPAAFIPLKVVLRALLNQYPATKSPFQSLLTRELIWDKFPSLPPFRIVHSNSF